MAKIRRDEVIVAALDLLNEVGLDGVTTRLLAQRLGVESPALYWHFRDKSALLNEMAAFVVAKHFATTIPEDVHHWREWFAQNARNFRQALLAFRDGARLHAGSTPDANELGRVGPKVDYLVRAGIPRREALMALLTAGQFTLGSVLEQQARQHRKSPVEERAALVTPSRDELPEMVERAASHADAAFGFGLELIIDGVHKRMKTATASATQRRLAARKPKRAQHVAS